MFSVQAENIKSLYIFKELERVENMLMEEIGSMKEEYLQELERMTTMKVILFGAGNTCEFNLKYFREHGINPIAFCDNSEEKQGKAVDDLAVLSLDAANELYPDAYYYITTQLYYKEIKAQLLNKGIAENRISEYDVVFQLQWERKCISYYIEKAEEVEKLYNSLADEKSREVLKNRMLFFRTRNRKYMLKVRDKQQYFDEELIDFNYVKCFVDLGMYIGDTILQFLQFSNGRYDTIYGFEPDNNIYITASANLKKYENIVCVNKATSDYDGKIEVEQSLGVMQTIETGIYEAERERSNTFKVCKLDTFFEKLHKKIDMIKLDIEGAELSALKGASNVIKRNHPIIAVCVYHKQEDIFEIPKYVECLNKKYNIYLRHYSDNQTETVCYFMPKEN